MCICFRMKIQGQEAMAVSPALRSKVLPSQRKAPQDLFRLRSGGPRVICTDFSSDWNISTNIGRPWNRGLFGYPLTFPPAPSTGWHIYQDDWIAMCQFGTNIHGADQMNVHDAGGCVMPVPVAPADQSLMSAVCQHIHDGFAFMTFGAHHRCINSSQKTLNLEADFCWLPVIILIVFPTSGTLRWLCHIILPNRVPGPPVTHREASQDQMHTTCRAPS